MIISVTIQIFPVKSYSCRYQCSTENLQTILIPLELLLKYSKTEMKLTLSKQLEGPKLAKLAYLDSQLREGSALHVQVAEIFIDV